MLARLARAVYRRLHPSARNSLRTWLMLEARDQPAEMVSRFDDATVMVLAPHMDDEVIGCGGALIRHVQAGARVHTVFMTDGRWGDGALHSDAMSASEKQQRQARLVEIRQEEARAAAAVMGTHELHFLNLPDGALQPDVQAVDALAKLLAAVKPAWVYLPFVFDLHEDHWQTNRVFAQAALHVASELATPHKAPMQVRGYEVWTPLLANRLLDISEVMPQKLKALACFASQLVDQDYLRIVDGMNRYRSAGAMGGRGHAEAFHELPLNAYLNLVQLASEARAPERRLATWSAEPSLASVAWRAQKPR